VDRAMERLDGADATTPCELREPTHFPHLQPPIAFKSVLSHGRTHKAEEPKRIPAACLGSGLRLNDRDANHPSSLLRRVCSMKAKMVLGALLVSVALASQGFSMDFGDRLAGLNCGGCGECKACAAPAPCKPAAKACAPAAVCGQPTCETCCKRCDLIKGMKDLFACRNCGKVKCCCEKPCAAPACCEKGAPKACDPGCCVKAAPKPAACCPAPACCEKVAPKACAPACCEKVAPKACAPANCGQPTCEKKCCCPRTPVRKAVVAILDALFCRPCDKPACKPACAAGPSCCGVVAPACGGGAPAGAPAPAPNKVSEDLAPLPIAPNPKPDPSA